MRKGNRLMFLRMRAKTWRRHSTKRERERISGYDTSGSIKRDTTFTQNTNNRWKGVAFFGIFVGYSIKLCVSVSSLSNIVKRWTSKRERDQPIRWWGFKKFCWLWIMTWPGHKRNDRAWCEDKKRECEGTQRLENCRATQLNFVWGSPHFPI